MLVSPTPNTINYRSSFYRLAELARYWKEVPLDTFTDAAFCSKANRHYIAVYIQRVNTPIYVRLCPSSASSTKEAELDASLQMRILLDDLERKGFLILKDVDVRYHTDHFHNASQMNDASLREGEGELKVLFDEIEKWQKIRPITTVYLYGRLNHKAHDLSRHARNINLSGPTDYAGEELKGFPYLFRVMSEETRKKIIEIEEARLAPIILENKKKYG